MAMSPARELPSAVGRLHRLRRPADCWGRQALRPQCGSVGKRLGAQLSCRAIYRPPGLLSCSCATTTTDELAAGLCILVASNSTGCQLCPHQASCLFNEALQAESLLPSVWTTAEKGSCWYLGSSPEGWGQWPGPAGRLHCLPVWWCQ